MVQQAGARSSTVNAQMTRPLAWLVDDNAYDRANARDLLRARRLDYVEIGSREAFQSALDDSRNGVTESPDIVILDLRLPWTDDSTLAVNAMSVGLECINLLRAEPSTAGAPIVVFSAFVENDELVRSYLYDYQPLTIVDKIQQSSLFLRVDNLLPTRRQRRRDIVVRWAQRHERSLLRIGALAAAVVAIGTLVAAVTGAFN
jgi:CheY-like chemotaxis protein